MMAGMPGGWVLRPLHGVADHALVEELWRAALEGRWPLLPRAIAMVRDGLFAVEGGRPVGFVAVDLAGSIPLVLVSPGCQRRGIGGGLLSAALGRLAAAGVSTARAGSGGADCIWPGVPLDLPAAFPYDDVTPAGSANQAGPVSSGSPAQLLITLGPVH
jgi:GNAT superfamily N-acetyltransferase